MISAMRHIHIFALALIVLSALTAGAQEAKTVVDYHTTVERLFSLENGMSMTEVNAALNSEPHDLLQNTKGGYLMLEYRYMKAFRKVKSSEADTESGRIIGTPQYREAASAYLLFDNDQRLVSWVTADAMGDIKHQYKLEATARRLGSMEAPCTRNCRIAIPFTEVEEEVEEVIEAVEEPEEKESSMGNLFGGLRSKLETMTNAVTPIEDPVVSPEVGASSQTGLGPEDYAEGDRVWAVLNGQEVKGIVATIGPNSMEVRYMDPDVGQTRGYFLYEEVRPRE